jgi:hypothetical protein
MVDAAACDAASADGGEALSALRWSGGRLVGPARSTLRAVLASSLVLGSSLRGFAIFALVLYFLPTIIALARKVTNQGSVVVINLFLGWTLIGWVVALAMACRTNR